MSTTMIGTTRDPAPGSVSKQKQRRQGLPPDARVRNQARPAGGASGQSHRGGSGAGRNPGRASATSARTATGQRMRGPAVEMPRSRPARPSAGRPGVSARSATAARTGIGAKPSTLRTTVAARAHPTAVPRAPFILLVLCLLGGGLICLLVINTTLGAASFQIDKLQKSANARTLQAQSLQAQIATDQSPARIAQEACALGMRPQRRLQYLDLRTHKLLSQRPGTPVQAPLAGCGR